MYRLALVEVNGEEPERIMAFSNEPLSTLVPYTSVLFTFLFETLSEIMWFKFTSSFN